MGSKSQTSSSTTSPNPAAMNAYMSLLGQAQTVGSTPYTPYTGELVPGVNAQQTTGINNINSSANYAQPYIQQAAGLATQASTPLTAAQIQQYQSPYTQGVVNATQAQFNNQNAQQLQGVKGNAIAQGALGGNREAVAEAETTNQQQLAQAPVIAGLENQGYQTGLNTALAEQQAQAQGAYSLGNLGVSGQNAALTGANAQVGAGNLQYGVSSATDQAAYQQFLNQQAFPYQQLQWQAGIDTGVGSALGGTSTTTQPGPNLFSQILGLGTAAAGTAGKIATANRGGRIQGLAVGGVPYGGTGAPYGGGVGYVPSMQITHGRGAPSAPGMGNQGGVAGTSPGGGSSFGDLGVAAKNLYNGYNANGSISGDQNIAMGQGAGVGFDVNGDALPGNKSGGRVGFADGGTPQGLAGVPDWLSDAQYTPSPGIAPVYADPSDGSVDASDINLNGGSGGLGLGIRPQWAPEQEAALADINRSQVADDGGLPPEILHGRSGPITVPPNRALSYTTEGISATPTDYAGVDDPDSAYNRNLIDRTSPSSAMASSMAYEHPHTDPWGAMIAAGLGMMASRSPFIGTAIGEGGLAGLKEYSGEQAQNIAEAEKKVNLAQQNKRIDLESTRLDQVAKNAQDQLNLKTKEQSEGTWYQQQEAAKPVVVRQDVDQFGITHPVYGKRAPDGTFVDPVTGKPIDSPAIDPMNSSSKGAPGTQVASADGTFTPEPGDLAGRNPEVLAAHPDLANTIKAIDEGRMNLGSVGFKQRTMLAQLVNQYDPSWDQSTWAARNKQQSDLTTNGNAGKMLLAVNQLLPHLKVASDKADALNNSSYPAANSISNWWATATGDPRVKTFEEVREVASMDAARLLRGSGTMAEKDIDFWRNNISSAGSPQQLQDQINTLADELMGARVESIKQQYRSIMGREPPPNWISNDAQSALSAIRARKPVAQSSSSAVPPNPVADKQALDWANANPNDPRAAQIKQRLGAQ